LNELKDLKQRLNSNKPRDIEFSYTEIKDFKQLEKAFDFLGSVINIWIDLYNKVIDLFNMTINSWNVKFGTEFVGAEKC
jgi:hypothetical protein